MALIMKVRCNGPEHHVNEVDLEKVLKPTSVFRAIPSDPAEKKWIIPERLVLPCQGGGEGKVVLTRAMIEAFLADHKKRLED